ncbi:MAG TPA: M20/M25/M40 family metallo-hydrolase [Gemmatimonadales bacterium]|nr:M20/M25/M40 family metallo-hydrolase [Gemmatimonadales bacterium]
MKRPGLEVQLLRDLVAIPSVSGSEAAIAGHVEQTARRWGMDVVRDKHGVRIEVRGWGVGPTLALASHLDVVPPGSGWTRDPFDPTVEGDRLYGRGSGDAKASVAAMLSAAKDVVDSGGMDAGRLVLLFGLGEETPDTTMGALVEGAGDINAAVIGEPTNLDIAIAQRGLMMVDLVAQGDQRHAGYAAENGFTNAALVLARDLLKLDTLFESRSHPLLGRATATPTMLESGVGRNVTPPVARAVLDVRSTPDWTHEELAQQLREALTSDVLVTSRRMVPCQTPVNSRLLETLSRLRPQAKHYGSPTCSDWVFLRESDAVKCGPGTSRRSHTADEYVDVPEVIAARGFYVEVARAYLGGQ